MAPAAHPIDPHWQQHQALHRVVVQAGTARAHRRRGVRGVEPLQQAG
jgi:hypothetical protein